VSEEGDRAAARERVRIKYFPAKIRELLRTWLGDEAEGGIFFSGTKKKQNMTRQCYHLCNP
jgi:hypothetical protein